MDAPRTWWIDQPFLLAGANPDNEELGRLRLQGFRAVVSLLEEDRQPPRYAKKSAAVAGWSTHCAPIREGGVPSLDRLGMLMAGLRTHAKRSRVFIHCESGQERCRASRRPSPPLRAARYEAPPFLPS